MSHLVLIIEDERDLAETLAYNLERSGYRTLHAVTGEAGLALAQDDETPDMVVLDLMLPGISGEEVCRRLRTDEATRGIPVIMLTAKGDEADRVSGLLTGADDYVVKPYSVKELLLRIETLLRRVEGAPLRTGGEIRFGRLALDREGRLAKVDEKPLSLTALEFDLLLLLYRRRGRPQSREALLDAVWGPDAFVQDRTVDAVVKRLREKLGPAGVYVETARGVGYLFPTTPKEDERGGAA